MNERRGNLLPCGCSGLVVLVKVVKAETDFQTSGKDKEISRLNKHKEILISLKWPYFFLAQSDQEVYVPTYRVGGSTYSVGLGLGLGVPGQHRN